MKRKYKNVEEIPPEVAFTTLRVSSERVYVKKNSEKPVKIISKEKILKIREILSIDRALDLAIISLRNPDLILIDLKRETYFFPDRAKIFKWENLLNFPERIACKMVWAFFRRVIKRATPDSITTRFLFGEKKFKGTLEEFFEKFKKGRVLFRASPEWLRKIKILLHLDGLLD